MKSVILLSLWSLVASATSEPACRHGSWDDELARLSCGDAENIGKCLEGVVDWSESSEIEHCLTLGGCNEDDATRHAVSLAESCRNHDLLKRNPDNTLEMRSVEANDITASLEVRQQPTANPPPGNVAPAATPAPTTETQDNPAAGAPGTTIQCSTTKMVTTNICFYTKGTKTCSLKTTASARCAPGIICQTDRAGNNICMKADNSLTTSGLVVALVFGIGVASFLVALFFMCCKDRRAFKKAERIRRNNLGVYKPDVEGGKAAAAVASFVGKPKASESHLPLMSDSTTRLERERTNNSDLPTSDDLYSGRDRNPFDEQPSTYAGAGALGQDNRI